MKIASAKLVPWSSVVGQSVALLDDGGAQIALLSVIGADSTDSAKDIGQQIVDLFEDVDRYKAVVENLHLLSTSKKSN